MTKVRKLEKIIIMNNFGNKKYSILDKCIRFDNFALFFLLQVYFVIYKNLTLI